MSRVSMWGERILKTISKTEAADFIEQGIISGGMIPKVLSAFKTLDSGVGKIHLIDGKATHSLLLEIFTHEGVGTQFIAEQESDHY